MTECWQVGDISVTKLPEVDSWIPATDFFPNLDAGRLSAAEWLRPHYVDPAGAVGMSVHSFLVRTPTARIVVDTCNGNDKPRSYESMSMLATPYLDRMAAAGWAPESVDLVVCTHLHFDHVGWNTRLVDGAWVPTFPNARYVFSRAEWDFWSAEPHAQDQFDSGAVLADSVWPLERSAIDLVDDGAELTAGVHVNSFAGHTPGHLCVWLGSGEATAVITGDAMHSPAQFVDPGWHGRADVTLDASIHARRRLIEQVAGTGTLVLGTHFPTPSGGYVQADGDTWRFIPARS